MSVLTVRRENLSDRPTVDSVTHSAFAALGREETPSELAIVQALRSCYDFIPELSLVAEFGGELAGHVIATRGHLEPARAVGIGPLSVDPRFQRRGVGAALMHSVLASATALDYDVAVLLGEPAFYSRFGLVTSTELGIAAPNQAWGDYFQARALSPAWTQTPGTVHTFIYAAPLQGA